MIAEYKKNVRGFWQEEPFDYLFYRPLAFVVVKGTYSLPLTPNHFSIMALMTALFSGFCLAQGTVAGFICGGGGILLFGVWDCCDGMLARMKRNGDPYGQFVDMFVDILSAISFYGGLCWGLRNVGGLYPWLVLLSGAMICIHAGLYNFYKKQFFFYDAGNPRGRPEEIETLKKDLQDLRERGGALFARFLIRSFLFFAGVQKSSEKLSFYDVKDYTRNNKMTLCFWSFIAGSSHLTLLALSLILSKIEFYLVFSLIFANVWLMWALLAQCRVNRSLSKPVLL